MSYLSISLSLYWSVFYSTGLSSCGSPLKLISCRLQQPRSSHCSRVAMFWMILRYLDNPLDCFSACPVSSRRAWNLEMMLRSLYRANGRLLPSATIIVKNEQGLARSAFSRYTKLYALYSFSKLTTDEGGKQWVNGELGKMWLARVDRRKVSGARVRVGRTGTEEDVESTG